MSRRLLSIMVLVAACAAVGALVAAPDGRAGTQSACEVTAYAPTLISGTVVSGFSQLECGTVTSGLALTTCLQRYQNSTGLWVELTNSCTRQPMSGTLTDVSIEGEGRMLCNSYPIAILYRTRAHGIWSPGGSGDDYSTSSALYCY